VERSLSASEMLDFVEKDREFEVLEVRTTMFQRVRNSYGDEEIVHGGYIKFAYIDKAVTFIALNNFLKIPGAGEVSFEFTEIM